MTPSGTLHSPIPRFKRCLFFTGLACQDFDRYTLKLNHVVGFQTCNVFASFLTGYPVVDVHCF